MKRHMISAVVASMVVAMPTHAQMTGGKSTWLGDVVARDMDSRIGGILGHVGIATDDAWSGDDMPRHASRVIEVLRQPVVIQLNQLTDFARLTKFWGSKYGVATYDHRGYVMLREANWQRWWEADYTITTDFKPGSGIPTTGTKISRGKFRCDTFVWWVYNNAGWDLRVTSMSPAGIFVQIPYFNGRLFNAPQEEPRNPDLVKKAVSDLSVDEINAASIGDLQMIVDAPPPDYVSNSTPQAEMEFAQNPDVDVQKREFMLDIITGRNNQSGIVDALVVMHRDDASAEIRDFAANRLMHYYEQYVRNSKNTDDLIKIKAFFSGLLNKTQLTEKEADAALSVFIDASAPDEVIASLDTIDVALKKVIPIHSIQHKYSLMFKSPKIQAIYMQSIVDELIDRNDSDLDSFLLGPLSMGLENSGKGLLLPQTQDILKAFLKSREERYSHENLLADGKDPYLRTTAPVYKQVRKLIGMD